MTGLVRKATLLLSVCGLLAASAAIAAVPDPGNSTFDKTKLNLVAHDGTLAHGSGNPAYTFLVHVEDLAGVNIENSVVVVDFSNCTDIGFCSDQLDTDAQPTVADCPTMTVRTNTDVNGDARFNIIGGALYDAGDPNGSPCNCVVVYADGVNIVETADEPVNAGTYDYNNTAGTIISDLSLWLVRWGDGLNGGYDNYTADLNHTSNCSLGAVNIADLSIWLGGWGVALNATGNASCSSLAVAKCGP